MKRALILGINGQDGSYLADLLVHRGYDVHGVVRRNSQPNLWRITHLLDKVSIHQGDLLDFGSISRIFWRLLPEEIYNEADQDHVGYSEFTPSYSASVTYGAVANLLELTRSVASPKVKLFQPLSATMFGDTPGPQTLKSKFDPKSPYAISKLAAHYLCDHYRKRYGMFVATAIMYNHDSVRRQGDYLLHKICKSAVKIAKGQQEYLALSNLDMAVDIGHAEEFMLGAYKLMQLDTPEHTLMGTGTAVSIRDLVKEAFEAANVVDPTDKLKETIGKFECDLVADTLHIKQLLNWAPTNPVHSLVHQLVWHYHILLQGA